MVTDLAMLSAATAPAAKQLADELDLLELLPFDDPVGSLRLADDAQLRALELGRDDLWQRARLVQADANGRRGDVAAAGRTSHEVNSWASERGHTHLLARSHRLISSFFDRIGDFSSALEHALLAVEHAGSETRDRTRADHVGSLAVALGRAGSLQAAREQFSLAGKMAAALDDVPLGLVVLNNQAFIEHVAGDSLRAMASAQRLLALAQEHGVPLDMSYLDTIARAQIGVGRPADAEQTLLPRLVDPGDIDSDILAESLLTLAAAQRRQGHHDDAWTTLSRCATVCEDGLDYSRVQLLQERAELLAACGRYREAYEEHQEFHAQHQAQFCADRESRARALHAVLQTEEARRDSDRFRELSVRDPLTGLYNRRYVEECAPVLLRAASQHGTPLSVALVDVDHFKRVNDTLSHQVGDTLLCLLAGLLADTVQRQGVDSQCFAARLGGDEFLLVLPGVTATDAVLLCERLQRRVRREVVIGVPVTTSIGVTCASSKRSELSAVLGNADLHLYDAKRAGRDRVVG